MNSEIKKVIFKPKHAMEIEVLELAYVTKRYLDEVLRPHRTNFHQIFLLKQGNPTHTVDFKSVPLHGESLFFINKSCVHSFDKSGDYEGLALIFTDDFFCKTDADRYFLRNAQLFNNPNLFLTISLDREFSFFYDNILRIKDELKMPTDSFQFEILHNTLHNILLRAERLAIQQNTQDIKKGADYEYTSLFRDLVENQYTKKKSVGEYASQLFISEKRLGQATTKILGMNPKEFINERIMLEAKRLLVHSNRSIKEIGIELGFDDPAYFFRYFRKYSESTPIEFREKYLNT